MVQLNVTFIDELYTVEPGETLTFGREADVVIDEDNQFMHRVIGRFVNHNEVWWLSNDGRRIELTAVLGKGKVVVLPPDESLALTSKRGVVRFDAGALSYELEFHLPAPVQLPEAAPDRGDAEPTLPTGESRSKMTADFGVIPLNPEQQLLLVALCEFRLRDPSADAAAMSSNAEIANRLGWSVKKFDRKLDYLCAKLTDRGVKGLRGGKGIEATTRRMNLVEHAIRNQLVTPGDLDQLNNR